MAKTRCVNVLITGAGGDLAVFIWKALKKSRLPVKIISCDCKPLAVGLYRASCGYVIPEAESPDYLGSIRQILRDEHIDIVMIGNMSEMDILSTNQADIEKETGAKLVVPPRSTLSIAKDKWELVKFLKCHGFAYPRSVLPNEKRELKVFLGDVAPPYVVKDRFASGSQGLSIAYDQKSMLNSAKRLRNPIIQEYLYPDDEEYTVGCFCNIHSKAIGSIVMKRRLGHGLTNKAQVLLDNTISSYCESVAEKMGFVGPANIQLRLTKDGPVIFEVNPRFSSTESARAYYNYNMPEMCIRNFVYCEDISAPKTTTGYFFRVFDDVFVDSESVETVIKTGVSREATGKYINCF